MPRNPSRWSMLGALVLAAGATAAAAPRSVEEVDYQYCYLAKQPYGSVIYFSEVFSVKSGTYVVGIQNSFNSHVSARHDPEAISGASCMGPYTERREAVDKLNDHIGERRRSGKRVVITYWRYRAD